MKKLNKIVIAGVAVGTVSIGLFSLLSGCSGQGPAAEQALSASSTSVSGGTPASGSSGATSSGSAGNTTSSSPPTSSSQVGVASVSANAFLNSLGVNTHIAQGVTGASTTAPLLYLGVRNIRDGDANISQLLVAHQTAGVKINLLGDGNLTGNIADAKTLANAGALVSVEGPNEPNNFTITYNGVVGGGQGSWLPVADFQRDLYAAVKADSVLKAYPVFGVSESGGEAQNVGVQFNTIPTGAGAMLPDGTKLSDYANVHNYVSSTNSTLYADNMAWNCASPTLNSSWDGLYVEHGVTWNGQHMGYTNAQLPTLPRVTTETGWDSVSNPGGERVQGVVLVNNYLAQFKEGWAYTYIYMLRDGEGGAGNQGLFNADSTPKMAATFIHNLTSVIADTGTPTSVGHLNYSIANEPATVHDLLLQKSSGTFELIVWGEAVSTTNAVTVNLGGSHATVNVYDVTSGSTAIKTYTNVSTVPLSMTDHAMIIEVIN